MQNRYLYILLLLILQSNLIAMEITLNSKAANGSALVTTPEIIKSKLKLPQEISQSIKELSVSKSPTYSINNPVIKEVNDACVNDDITLIKQLIVEHNITRRSSFIQDKWSLIHLAAQHNAHTIVNFLINDKGWPSTLWSATNKTSLEIAAKCNSLESFILLFNKMNKQRPLTIAEKKNFLHAACLYGALKIARYLIDDQKISPKKQHILEIPILCSAVASDNVDLLKYLIQDCDCDTYESSERFGSAVESAMLFDSLQAIKYFHEVLKLNLKEIRLEKGRTLLHEAAYYDALEVFIYLHEVCGIDLFVQDNEGLIPAFSAADTNALDILRYICVTKNQKEALVNFRTKSGETMLHATVKNDSLEAFKLLLEWGVDLQSVNNAGSSVYSFLIYYEAINIMKYLSEIVDLKSIKVGKFQSSLLHISARSKEFGMFKFLQNIGVPYESDQSGFTPLLEAAHANALEIMAFLIEQMKIPVDRKYSLKDCDNILIDNYTALHCAAEMDAIDVWIYLVKKGADFYVTNGFGETPLHNAAFNDSINIMKDFISKKPDYKKMKSICDKQDHNLMHAAVFGKEHKVLELLIDKYFDLIYQVNKNGKTPLMVVKSIEPRLLEKILKRLKDDNCTYHPKCVECDKQTISKNNYDDFDITDFKCMRVICNACKQKTMLCRHCVITPLRK